MRKEVRLVAFTNDAFALLASGFDFQLAKCRLASIRTASVSSISRHSNWEVRARSLNQVVSLSPKESRYFTLEEMLKGFPRGFSPKIERMISLYIEGNEVYVMRWVRETIHRSITIEDDYQQWTLNRINSAWKTLTEIDMDGRGPFEEPRPSLLVVESIRSLAAPEIEIMEIEDAEKCIDFLFRVLSRLYKNELAKIVYEVVYRIESKRGVWEYFPYKK